MRSAHPNLVYTARIARKLVPHTIAVLNSLCPADSDALTSNSHFGGRGKEVTGLGVEAVDPGQGCRFPRRIAE